MASNKENRFVQLGKEFTEQVLPLKQSKLAFALNWTPYAMDRSIGNGRSSRRRQSEITFHSLRHTATSLLKRAGVSNAMAMDLIGHDSEAVSRNYTHIDDATKRKALNKLRGNKAHGAGQTAGRDERLKQGIVEHSWPALTTENA